MSPPARSSSRNMSPPTMSARLATSGSCETMAVSTTSARSNNAPRSRGQRQQAMAQQPVAAPHVDHQTVLGSPVRRVWANEARRATGAGPAASGGGGRLDRLEHPAARQRSDHASDGRSVCSGLRRDVVGRSRLPSEGVEDPGIDVDGQLPTSHEEESRLRPTQRSSSSRHGSEVLGLVATARGQRGDRRPALGEQEGRSTSTSRASSASSTSMVMTAATQDRGDRSLPAGVARGQIGPGDSLVDTSRDEDRHG